MVMVEVSKYVVGRWERKRCRGSCAMRRSRTGDKMVLRNSLMWEPWAATSVHGEVQVPAVAKGHVWVHGPAIARVSVVSGYEDVWGLYCRLKPCWCWRTILSWLHPPPATILWYLLWCGLEWPCPLFGVGACESHLWWLECRKAGRLTNSATTEAQIQGLELAHPSIFSSWTCRTTWRGQSCRSIAAGSPQLRQQQDAWESLWGSSIDVVAEARNLKLDSQFVAMNIVK